MNIVKLALFYSGTIRGGGVHVKDKKELHLFINFHPKDAPNTFEFFSRFPCGYPVLFTT